VGHHSTGLSPLCSGPLIRGPGHQAGLVERSWRGGGVKAQRRERRRREEVAERQVTRYVREAFMPGIKPPSNRRANRPTGPALSSPAPRGLYYYRRRTCHWLLQARSQNGTVDAPYHACPPLKGNRQPTMALPDLSRFPQNRAAPPGRRHVVEEYCEPVTQHYLNQRCRPGHARMGARQRTYVATQREHVS
jgi:hypothetical protein